MDRRAWIRVFGLASLVGLLGLAALPVTAREPTPPSPTQAFVDGRVIVGFKDGTTATGRAAALATGAGRADRVIGRGAHVITVAPGRVMATIEALKKDPRVRYAEPDYIYHLTDLPNDPSVPLLWGMENTGQPVNGTSGTPDADIDAAAAWTVTRGSSSVIVGVVDTGIDYNHPDLAANVWSNPGGIGGCPAGTHGYNAIAHTCDPLDDNNHGSHTSGTIGAVGDNGIGVAGINWDVSIIALKAFNAGGSTTSTSIAESLQWALDAKRAGVNIRALNNSWGGWESSQITLDLINQLAAEDVLFVAAAGNFGIPNTILPFYPCDYPVATIICVGASTQLDRLASFSNYGASSVDLAAPGTNVLSTVRNGGYGYADGTSMATPHVTGAAALLQAGGDLPAAEVKAAILDGVDVLPALAGKVGTSGRLNLVGALAGAIPPGTPGAPALSGSAGDGVADLSWTTPDAGDAQIDGYRVYRGTSTGNGEVLAEVGLVNAYNDPGLDNGTTYFYRVAAFSALGEGQASNQLALTPTAPPTLPGAPILSGLAGDGLARLCWTEPDDGNASIDGYRLYRTEAATETAIDAGTGLSYEDAGLANGTTYAYEVAALNVVGEGPRSTPLSLTPPGTSPTVSGFSPTIAVAGSSITIEGTALAGCGTTVRFGAVAGTQTGGTATQIVATSPSAGGSGKVTVTTAAGSSTSAADFFAVPAGSTAADVAVADRMSIGQTRAVPIGTAGRIGLLLFDGTAGDRISLRMTSTISSTDVTILNPDGSTLASASGIGTSGGFIDTRLLGQSGTHTIVVNPRTTGTGTMTLTLYAVPPDATAAIVAGGPAVPLAIGIPGQNGSLTFTGTAGDRISLRMTSTISSTDVTILNPDGSTLASASGIGTSGGFIDTRLLGQSGTHTIVVNPRTTGTGTMTLTLYAVPPDATAAIVAGGPAVPLAIGIPGQNGSLTFTGTAGDRISLRMTSTISSTDVTILNPDGSTLASASGIGTSGGFIDTRLLGQSGTHTIVVNPRTTGTGTMTLTLYAVPPDATAAIVAGGPAVPLAIGIPGQNGSLTFTGTAGDRISLRMTSTISSTDVTILNPDGSTLASASGIGTSGGFIDTRLLGQSGTHTIVVNPRTTGTGTMTLTLYAVPPDATAAIVAGGPAVPLAIGIPGQNGSLTFTGTAGVAYSLVISAVTITQADVSIQRPNGTNFVNPTLVTTAGKTIGFTANVTGTYTIRVDPRVQYTGSMTFRL